MPFGPRPSAITIMMHADLHNQEYLNVTQATTLKGSQGYIINSHETARQTSSFHLLNGRDFGHNRMVANTKYFLSIQQKI